jgi:hypothetical protein
VKNLAADNYSLNDLIGRRIRDVYMSADKTKIAFVTNQRTFFFETEGDCCSHSWIEHVTNAENLSGAVVTAIEEVDMSSLNFKEDYDHIKVYLTRFHLEGRQPFDLEYRNSSNGYYGGCISPSKPKSLEDMNELTSDF